MEKIKSLTLLKKVTKSGENTFAVSIPIKFIRDNDLKKGDLIEITLKKLEEI